MSIDMDDYGVSRPQNYLRSDSIESKKLQTPDNVVEQTGQEENRPEINDVFENNHNRSKEELVDIQERNNSLEVEKRDLEKLAERIETLQTAKDEFSDEKLKQELDEINKALNQQDQPVENSGPQTTENSGPQTTEREETNKKINELKSQVADKQQEVMELQSKIRQEVSSIVEIKVENNANNIETQEIKEYKLNNAVTESILKDPEQSFKMQVLNIDKNLILAMLSLRR